MTIQQQDRKDRDREKQEREKRLNVSIGQFVMNALGQPGNLHRVQVKRLWEDHFRVNVLVGPDAASARVAHSYFLVADNGGTVIASSPNISKHY